MSDLTYTQWHLTYTRWQGLFALPGDKVTVINSGAFGVVQGVSITGRGITYDVRLSPTSMAREHRTEDQLAFGWDLDRLTNAFDEALDFPIIDGEDGG